jgi:hypothetical protein
VTSEARRWRVIAVAVGLAIVLAQWVRIAFDPSSDFANHWTFGLRFVRGAALYEGGLDVPYPPFWAMAHAPLTLLPPAAAQLLIYPLGPAALVGVLWVLNRLTRDDLPVDDSRVFWIAAGTLVLASRFIVRDLADSGPNLLLVAVTWGGIYLWTCDRPWRGGALVGVAIALKATAAVFVAYFVLRRAWRLAAAAAVTALILSVAPALWQGPELYGMHIRTWMGTVRTAWSSEAHEPGVVPLNERVDNIALGSALTRHLMRTHAGEQLRAMSSRWPDPAAADLDPAVVAKVVAIVTIGLVVAVSLAIGGRPVSPRDPRVVWDCAAMGTLALLLSPITWRQHAVAIVPACYLLLRLGVSRGALPPLAWAALGMLTLSALVLSRGLMGTHVAFLVNVYSLHTWTLVLLLAATLHSRPVT